MIQAKCTEKIRDKNNHIIGYRIVDKNKNEVLVKAEKLKEVIRAGKLDIVNLTLTSDNRLIDKKPDTVSKPTTTPSSKQSISAEAVLAKARATGCNITTFDTDCGHKCYIVSSPDNTKHFLLIPDNVEYLYNLSDRGAYNTNRGVHNTKLSKYMSNIEGTLKVVGGKGLTSTVGMFYNCAAQSIDLRSLDTSNVTDMQGMFNKCEVQSIDLSSFDTSNVTDMGQMFYKCEAKSIDLRSFNTSNVKDMERMFNKCTAQSLDLSSFNTSKITDMWSMFSDCKVQSLDLSSFKTRNVTNMRGMFYECKAQSINLSSFNTSDVTDMGGMFCECEAQSIDLRSFDTSNVKDMEKMFYKCKAQSIDLTSFDTSNVRPMWNIFNGCKAQIKVNDPKLKEHLKSRR